MIYSKLPLYLVDAFHLTSRSRIPSRDDGERINYVSDELQHDSIVRFRLASSTYVDRMIDIGLFF